ncbi:MAG: hypothetical protein SNJ84_10460 [Verrucomicrobiia bacterium]
MNRSHHLKLATIAAIPLAGVVALIPFFPKTPGATTPVAPLIEGSLTPLPLPPNSAADRRELLQRAANDPHHTDLRARFARALADATPSEFPDLAALLDTIPRDLDPAPLWRELLRAWARHDGPTAFTFALNHDIAIVGAIDAMAAWDATHPDQPAQFLAAIPDPDQRQFQTIYLAGTWLRRDPTLAMELVAALPDSIMRQSGIHHVARTIATHPTHPDPAAAGRWLASLTHDPASHRATGWLAGAWASSLPQTAALWVDSLTSQDAKAAAYYELIGSWAGAEPEAAGQWLATRVGQPELDRAVAEYARIALGQDPSSARSWIAHITDPGLRAQMEQEMAERIAGTELDANEPIPIHPF